MRFLPLILITLLSQSVLSARAEPRIARAVPANNQASTAGDPSSVILRSNDVFELRLSGMPPDDASQFNGPQTVGSDGQVNVLYVGRIQAAGRTAGELERAIEKALIDKKIFRWPTAIVNISMQTRFVTIGGHVRAPSRPQWSADLTLSSALLAAGGGDDWASDKVHLIRGGKVTVYSVKKLRRDPSQDQRLLPGDQVELQ
jgi:protein involved in polysaccharide export with SLBB domain